MPTNKHKNYFAPLLVRRIFDLGVGDQLSSWENNVTRLLNQLLLLSTIGNLFLAVYHIILGNTFPVFFALMSLVVNAGIFFLQHRKKLLLARLAACFYYPLLIFTIVYLGGDSLRGEYIFFTVSFVCAILFQRRWLQLTMASYCIGLYILSQWILEQHSAPLAHLVHPFDRYLLFGVSVLSLFFLANGFFKEIVTYRKERERLLEQLIASNTKLKQMNYVVSHDLRSPLRRIASFTDLARRANNRREEQLVDEYLATVKHSARKLHDFIHDMLAFAQLDDQSIQFQPVLLDTLLQETKEQYSSEDVLLEIVNTEKEAAVLGNKTLLAVIFQNLVENAIKYNTSSLPQIDISLLKEENGIALRFSDNGIGIPEEKREDIFEIFTRLHDSSQYEGTGIGLATVKGIVELHRGTIEVEPQAVGTCFLIRLPLLADENQIPISLSELQEDSAKPKVFRLVRKRRASLF